MFTTADENFNEESPICRGSLKGNGYQWGHSSIKKKEKQVSCIQEILKNEDF